MGSRARILAAAVMALASSGASPLPPARLDLSAVNVVFYGTPQPLGCPQRGWEVKFAAGGTVLAAAVTYDPATRVTTLYPAVRQCVFQGGFE